MEGLRFWVVGGDRRQLLLAGLLAEDGHEVHTWALGETAPEGVHAEKEMTGIGEADCVIFPLPVSREEGVLHAPLAAEAVALDAVLAAMRPGQLALGGQMDEAVIRGLRARGLRWRDYFTREELTVANAIPTAEGGIQAAMEALPTTLHGARVLILGYGRIGRMLALRLRGLGARVTAAARRREQLAWAGADGCRTCPLGEVEAVLGDCDVIFNTAPAILLTEERLKKLKPGCPVIDLASEPGGVDLEAAKSLDVRVIRARGLPGKVAPLTAARILKETVCHILEEVPV